MICCCFLQEVATALLMYTIHLKAIFTCHKIQILINLIFFLFKQTLKTLSDITLLFYDRVGLDMNLRKLKSLYRKAWENDFDHKHYRI